MLLSMILVVAGVLFGCMPQRPEEGGALEEPGPFVSPPATSSPQTAQPRILSAWAAYWDTGTVVAELAPIASELDALCYFEVFYDDAGGYVLPDELLDLRKQVDDAYPDHAWRDYLTFVNDLQTGDGEFVQKTCDVLKPFLSDQAAMEQQILAMLELTRQHGFDGIELDFEAIRKAPKLWQPFVDFCELLWQRASKEGLDVRIVLESHAPFDRYAFPEGPQYVVMCYNLYGGHSGPGPKADLAYLRETARAVAALPGECCFALATGGYSWKNGKNATQLTESAAQELLSKKLDAQARRDDASGAMTFSYKSDSSKYAVWYADVETFSIWEEALRENGHTRIAYWRLGGNATGFPTGEK